MLHQHPYGTFFSSKEASWDSKSCGTHSLLLTDLSEAFQLLLSNSLGLLTLLDLQFHLNFHLQYIR